MGAGASQLLMVAILVAAAAATAHALPLPSIALPDFPAGLARLATGPTGVILALGLIGRRCPGAGGDLPLGGVGLVRAARAGATASTISVRRAPGFYLVYLLEVVPAALIALLAPSLGAVVLGAMILNVVVLAVPLTFLVRLSSDREVLGPLANSRRRAAVLWAVTGGLLLPGPGRDGRRGPGPDRLDVHLIRVERQMPGRQDRSASSSLVPSRRDGVRDGAFASRQQHERHGQRLDGRRYHDRHPVAADVGHAPQGRLGDHAAGRAHE